MSYKLPTLTENDNDHFPSMFGVSEERFHELTDHIDADLRAASKEKDLSKSKVLEVFVSKTENVEELAFMSFMAGSFAQQIENN